MAYITKGGKIVLNKEEKKRALRQMSQIDKWHATDEYQKIIKGKLKIK